jgi:alpha-beta hydrolase superfamily lysophospholipase
VTSMEAGALARISKHLPVLLITGEADSVSNGALQVRALEQRLRDAELDVTAKYYVDASRIPQQDQPRRGPRRHHRLAQSRPVP